MTEHSVTDSMNGNHSAPNKESVRSVYVLGPAAQYCDGGVGGYGQIAMWGPMGEDFADTHWPVVVKAKTDVTRETWFNI